MNTNRFTKLIFLGFSLFAAQFTWAGSTERVTLVDISGNQGNGSSGAYGISADGRYVVISSAANNLVVGDTNGVSDVFVRDRMAGTTTRVSVASPAIGGAQGNNFSVQPNISADGRYVTFMSRASNLVVNDTNGVSDIFVHELSSGITTRVSVATGGAQGNQFSSFTSISEDGQYIAFRSSATNLVTGDLNGARDIFVHDRNSSTTTRVSVDSFGVEGNMNSDQPSISLDGQYVAFASLADNLVGPGNDNNVVQDIFVRDRTLNTTERVSVVDSTGLEANNGSTLPPSISEHGRYVAFASLADNLVGPGNDSNVAEDIFVRDRHLGTTELVSVDGSGNQGNGHSLWPSISADGNYVAFISVANNLVPFDSNGTQDIFVHELSSGMTTRVSVDNNDVEGNGASTQPSIRTSNRYVTFNSNANNLDLVLPDTNSRLDGFVRDRVLDSDGDGVPDDVDNCTFIPNPAQVNTNFPDDNCGNACDPDVDNNAIVNFLDFSIIVASITGTFNPDADFSGPLGVPDVVSNFFDLARFVEFWSLSPGPGATSTGGVTCP